MSTINNSSNSVLEEITFQKNNYADLVTDKIRRAIVTGEIHAGERLVETTLADQLGISRVPIREAFKHLEAEGIIIRNKIRGYEVWTPTKKDVDEIVSLRKNLECIAYETAVRNLRDQDCLQLDQLMSQCKIEFDNRNFPAVVSDDRAFHEAIVKISGNRRVIVFWGQIMTQWEILQSRGSRLDLAFESDAFVKTHKDILFALQVGDLAEATRILSWHCELSRGELKRAVEFNY